jgi:hypothetical protein
MRTASRSPLRKRAAIGAVVSNHTSIGDGSDMFTSDFTIAASSRGGIMDDSKVLKPWTFPANVTTHMTRIGPSNEGEVLTENKIVREALSYLLPFIRHMNNSFSPMADEAAWFSKIISTSQPLRVCPACICKIIISSSFLSTWHDPCFVTYVYVLFVP